jgi:hypothetical protein
MAVEIWVSHWVLNAHSEVYLVHWGHPDRGEVATFDVQTTQQSAVGDYRDRAKIGLVNPPEVVHYSPTIDYFFRVRHSGNTLGNFTIYAQVERY